MLFLKAGILKLPTSCSGTFVVVLLTEFLMIRQYIRTNKSAEITVDLKCLQVDLCQVLLNSKCQSLFTVYHLGIAIETDHFSPTISNILHV